MILKDLGIANKAGKNLGLALEIGKKTFEMYDAMCKSGLNEKDFSVIYNYVSKRTKWLNILLYNIYINIFLLLKC